MDFSTMHEKIGRNDAFAPGYSSIIREPMDFSTVHKKIGKILKSVSIAMDSKSVLY
jgi:hypothetical protein